MADMVVLKAAAAEYAAALRSYAERSVAAAEGFETAISQAIEAIALQPLWYPACDERHRFVMVRHGSSWFVMVRGYPYQLIYRLDSPDSLVVVAVAHGSREPTFWLGR